MVLLRSEFRRIDPAVVLQRQVYSLGSLEQAALFRPRFKFLRKLPALPRKLVQLIFERGFAVEAVVIPHAFPIRLVESETRYRGLIP